MANTRGAGRKPVFSDETLNLIMEEHRAGDSITNLASKYNVSRQTMSSYITKINNQDVLIEIKDSDNRFICRGIKYWQKLNADFVSRGLESNEGIIKYGILLEYMNKNTCTSRIIADFKSKKVLVINETDDVLHRAFGANICPTWKDFEEFLSWRCFPKDRFGRKMILKDMGLDSYDELAIIEKTSGRMEGDFQWFRIIHFPDAMAI